MKDYTIECDVLGTTVQDDRKENLWPDVGIGANRYKLVLAGEIQKLRLVSWDVLPRIDKTIDYPWKAGVWYRLKLTVEIQGDGTGVAKGKAWERNQPEPAEWTIKVADPRPNVEGSPDAVRPGSRRSGGPAGNGDFLWQPAASARIRSKMRSDCPGLTRSQLCTIAGCNRHSRKFPHSTGWRRGCYGLGGKSVPPRPRNDERRARFCGYARSSQDIVRLPGRRRRPRGFSN